MESRGGAGEKEAIPLLAAEQNLVITWKKKKGSLSTDDFQHGDSAELNSAQENFLTSLLNYVQCENPTSSCEESVTSHAGHQQLTPCSAIPILPQQKELVPVPLTQIHQ